jgi:hypothetical protein
MQLHGGNITKRKGKMTKEMELAEVKSAYEKEIAAFVAKGGKVKKHTMDRKTIEKAVAKFQKQFKIMKKIEIEKDIEDELERKKNAEAQEAREEAEVMNKYVTMLQKERSVNLWAEAKKVNMFPPPVDGKKTMTGKPQNKAKINPTEKGL